MNEPASTGIRTVSHDLPESPEFASFMARDWAPSPLPDDIRLPAADLTPAAAPASRPASPASD
ncbi:Xaa-Pro aminopeptidase [Streptomyces alboflavus]|uniref:Xaa-Pro aminopeptidase n=1 Tax=Streptomyces alboflavus TaxID=67267 RepID=A0A1Z1W447_9ACTN|nr:Xaa-Pro aminopeptidase [Streptomyces alboflavus]